MNRQFHFSAAVVIWLIALTLGAIAFGLAAPPPAFLFVGGSGLVAMFVAQLSARFRTGRWSRWDIDVPFTLAEGLAGSSGAALVLAMFAVAGIYTIHHAA